MTLGVDPVSQYKSTGRDYRPIDLLLRLMSDCSCLMPSTESDMRNRNGYPGSLTTHALTTDDDRIGYGPAAMSIEPVMSVQAHAQATTLAHVLAVDDDSVTRQAISDYLGQFSLLVVLLGAPNRVLSRDQSARYVTAAQ